MNFPSLQILLDDLLHAERFAGTDDQNGVFRPPARPDADVRRLGLALAPGPGWQAWAERERCDAVFLHRPWGAEHALAAAGVGALGYHLAFDEFLTTGFNPTLAAACGWGEPVVCAEKEGRPLGMVCALADPATPLGIVVQRLTEEFGGLEGMALPPEKLRTTPGRVACVGAMNDKLVRAAHAAGAGVYVTGQWREPARAAVRETGIAVVAIGHHRSEVWGLRTLARLLRADPAMGGVEIVVADEAGR